MKKCYSFFLQSEFRIIFNVVVLLLLTSVKVNGQTSVSMKSQWLDPTNLFTEKKPTVEFNSTFSVGDNWSLNFYYAHDVQNLTPIYLISGVNNTHVSEKLDSLCFVNSETRTFPKYSRNIFVSYQYSETVRHLSWIQPIVTWEWNLTKSASRKVHTFTTEASAWMSVQRGDVRQDGGFINGKYSYSKLLNKWVLKGSLTTIGVEIFEANRDVFVLGEVLRLSSIYLPLKTSLEVVLNKPLITPEDNKLGFTIGLTKEF